MKRLSPILVFCFLMLFSKPTDVGAEIQKTIFAVAEITAQEETIKVPITVEENNGISGAMLNINYDENLKLLDISEGTAFSSLNMTVSGNISKKSVKILWDGSVDDSSNGEIAILTFENPNKTGKYAISLECEKSNAVDDKLQLVESVTKNGYIEVSSHVHSGGEATCSKRAVCEKCGEEYGELNSTNHKGKVKIRNAKPATIDEEGYTGDAYCTDCNQLISKGTLVPKLSIVENAPIITVSNSKVVAGKKVVVSVDISKNPGIAGYSYDINYDKNAMTLESITAGNLLTGKGQISTNQNVVNWYAADNVSSDGTLMELIFTVNKETDEGTYPVSISLHDGKKNLVDEKGNFIEANYVAGQIEVTSGVLGDLNDDGDITIADVVILNRHVLGKEKLTDAQLTFADINGDGDATIADVVILNRVVLGKESLSAIESLLYEDEISDVGNSESSSDAGMQIFVKDIEAEPGSTVDVPVYISGNTGIAGLAFDVDIPKGYTLNAIKAGDILTGGTFSTYEKSCTWYIGDNIKADGLLFTLNITVPNMAGNGKITVGVKDGKVSNLSNEKGQAVRAKFVAGGVTVKEAQTECDKNGHKGGKATCISKAICEVCGKEYGETNPNNHTGNTEIRDKKEATYTEKGYTGDVYCTDCGTKLSDGIEIPMIAPENPTVIKPNAFSNCASLIDANIKDTVTEIGNEAFADCKNLANIYFYGNSPKFGNDVFRNVKATAYYPYADSTWTPDKLQGYGGEITWIPWNSETKEPAKRDLSACRSDIATSGYAYTGKAQKPEITITDGDYLLEEGKDYDISCTDNTDAGTASFKVTGTGTYGGKLEGTFLIEKASPVLELKEKTITISVNEAYWNEWENLITDGEIRVFADNEKLVSVDVSENNILCTAKHVGKVKITVTAEEGRNYVEGSTSFVLNIGKGTNRIIADSIIKNYSSRSQYITTGWWSYGNNKKLIYASNSKYVKISSAGKITIAKGFTGRAIITIKVAATKDYNANIAHVVVTVRPSGTSVSKVTNSTRGKAGVVWKKNTTGTGYAIQYSVDKSFKNSVKTVYISKNKTTKATLSGLKKGKTYYVRIAVYKAAGSRKVLSSWSKVKSVKIRK